LSLQKICSESLQFSYILNQHIVPNSYTIMPKYYFDRLDYLNSLIKKKATGAPEQLARKLNVSERTIFEYLEILKSLGADIKYNRDRQSYYYTMEGTFDFHFKKSQPHE
jgi:biotin operon repressor